MVVPLSNAVTSGGSSLTSSSASGSAKGRGRPSTMRCVHSRHSFRGTFSQSDASLKSAHRPANPHKANTRSSQNTRTSSVSAVFLASSASAKSSASARAAALYAALLCAARVASRLSEAS